MSKIGVDIDEILSETVKAFLFFYNAEYGTTFIFDEVIDYSFAKQFGITRDEERQAIQDFFGSKLALDIPTVPESIKCIKDLSQRHELYAISSRPPQLIELTKSWLDDNFPGCFREIILTNSHFDATKTKSDVCRTLSLDMFIDDQIIYAEDCARVCAKVLLMNKPWNQTNIVIPNVLRVKSWQEIVQEIERNLI